VAGTDGRRNTAPKEMKAPANKLSTNEVNRLLDARRAPVFSARTAISAGMIASNVMI
jgi:hypothetical protein